MYLMPWLVTRYGQLCECEKRRRGKRPAIHNSEMNEQLQPPLNRNQHCSTNLTDILPGRDGKLTRPCHKLGRRRSKLGMLNGSHC